ncbi:MAG TPA: type II toxin-antitoxin system prevent-host-death family antitoxin [Caulobacteraceae bacterium]|nr:type II toxin-antitoxin system prevent-host-death family antitoxin [Caulobacteraceae bacterium]
MTTHSVAEAKNHLSGLIARAMKGETVVITRHGHPVVELKAVTARGRPMTKADVDLIISRQIVPSIPDGDPRSIVERMRDEDAERLL